MRKIPCRQGDTRGVRHHYYPLKACGVRGKDRKAVGVVIFEEKMFMLDVYNKLFAAEEQLKEGKVLGWDASLKSIREKYNV
ncbi:hypothetical protein Desgi_3504 [Desulfoscipio gibsoniae DSM 7213]|uniref:Uncharacterized protein n=1 Tax=Desulfoscipio gibsoniae DSM 7213 TaxID=767817 RepID=R4KQH1_9FIRM|nr:hypothetical protein Desgi_3504 [Desulfoscipio gibsoniae DSM 7213]